MRNIKPEACHTIEAVERRVRLILLLRAAENAGLTPLPILHLHTLAYMSDVLSPVWEVPVFEGKVLKRRGSPFYISLQRDLDRLVGMGVVLVSSISHVLDEDGRWRLEGSYRLHRPFADPILKEVAAYEDEWALASFIQELAYALSALGRDDLTRATSEDATYADPVVDVGNVVDFAEWDQVNCAANAARRFEQILPGGARATRAEMLHLYVRHLYGRLWRA